jgi:hypothetical protein
VLAALLALVVVGVVVTTGSSLLHPARTVEVISNPLEMDERAYFIRRLHAPKARPSRSCRAFDQHSKRMS